MPEKISPHDILQSTHAFLKTRILPTLNWPELDIAVDHWINRHEGDPNNMFTDTLPAIVSVAFGKHVEMVVPMNSGWLLYLIAARVFDDIQDGEGNGRPWNRHGLSHTLPVGIGLMSAATVCLSHQTADADTLRSIYHMFGMTGVEAAQAQWNERIDDVWGSDALDAYFAHIIGATAKVVAVGAWAGGFLSGAKGQTLKALYDYGYNVGMKFAILDDCQDLIASEYSSSDLVNGRYRLPVLYAMGQPDHSARSQLRILLQGAKNSKATEIQAVKLLDEMGAIAWSLNLAQVYQQKALGVLDVLSKDVKETLAAHV